MTFNSLDADLSIIKKRQKYRDTVKYEDYFVKLCKRSLSVMGNIFSKKDDVDDYNIIIKYYDRPYSTLRYLRHITKVLQRYKLTAIPNLVIQSAKPFLDNCKVCFVDCNP